MANRPLSLPAIWSLRLKPRLAGGFEPSRQKKKADYDGLLLFGQPSRYARPSDPLRTNCPMLLIAAQGAVKL